MCIQSACFSLPIFRVLRKEHGRKKLTPVVAAAWRGVSRCLVDAFSSCSWLQLNASVLQGHVVCLTQTATPQRTPHLCVCVCVCVATHAISMGNLWCAIFPLLVRYVKTCRASVSSLQFSERPCIIFWGWWKWNYFLNFHNSYFKRHLIYGHNKVN